MKKRFFLPCLTLIVLVLFFQTAYSDVPQLISFQGRIVDANSQPLADGSYSMTFKIWDAVAAGSQLWTETQGTVSVTNGLFSVLLGSVASLSSLTFNQDYWLEITVGASTYSPRQRITSAGYALNVPDLRITTAKLANDAVTDAKVVDALTISGGTVNSTPVGQTIAAAGSFTTLSSSSTTTLNSATTIGGLNVCLANGTNCSASAGGWTDGGTDVYLTTITDKVGIGDATPTNKLDVTGAIGISDTTVIDASRNLTNIGTLSSTYLTTGASYVNAAGVATVFQMNGTTVIDASKNISNIVNFTNTGNTQLGDGSTDVLNVYPDTTTLTGNTNKILDVGPGVLNTTLTIQNSNITGVANLSVEGTVTASSFSGSSSNALACSGDATCETNAVYAAGNVYPSLTNTYTLGTVGGRWSTIYGVAGDLSGNLTVTGTLDTGQGATEVYLMNQPVQTTNNVTFANITGTGNTILGDAGADTLTLNSTIMDWNNVDEDKTIQIGSGITNRTLNITNPDVTGVANLTVEGTVTATTFSGAFSGTATNSNACSSDATCEVQSIQRSGNLTIDALNAAATSTVTVTNSNVTYKAQLALEDTNTVLSQGGGNALRVTTNTGYTEIGPQNASWSHFITDRPSFYFNAPVVPAGNTYPYTNNTYTLGTSANRWSTIYGVNGDISGSLTVSGGQTVSGEIVAAALRTPTSGYSSGALLDVGDAAVDYPGNAGWAATWNSNLLLSGLNSTSISFHDGGLRVDTLRSQGGTFYLGENVGWGVANLSVGGTITTPGYISITGASDGSGNLRFSAANPYISASSYFIAPGGAYFNSGTVYTEAAIQARGGISNDSANCGGYLCLNENTLVTGAGWLRVDGDEGIYMESWGGGWHMTDATWMRSYNSKSVYTLGWMRADSGFDKGGVPITKTVAYANGSGWVTCGTTGWAAIACYDASGNVQPPNACPYAGTMICMWTSGL